MGRRLQLQHAVIGRQAPRLPQTAQLFSLPVTIEGATGQARKSLQWALDCQTRAGKAADAYRPMTAGFKRNDRAMAGRAAIASFDLDRE